MNNSENRPQWMNDPLVKDISPQKLSFLEKMFEKSQGKSQKELMGSLIPLMKQAQQEHLTFTPAEMNAAISAVKKHSTPEEIAKMDKILEKAKQNKTGGI